MIKGFDISSFQPRVDFDKAVRAGNAFVFVKATEGLQYTSSTFLKHWAASKAAGILRGPYHFFRPREDAKKQIERYVKTVVAAGDNAELPYAFDFEGHKAIDGVQPQLIVDAALTGLAHLEFLTGLMPLLYTGPGFFNSLRNGSKRRGLVPAKNCMELTRYPLWQAQYASHVSPMPWPKTPAGNSWTFWQNAGSEGVVAGVDGACDTNMFAGSEEALVGLRTERRAA